MIKPNYGLLRSSRMALRAILLALLAVPVLADVLFIHDQLPAATAQRTNSSITGSDSSRLSEVARRYGNLPLSFEQNLGQTAREVKYLSRGAGYAVFLTAAGAVMSITKPEVATGEVSTAPRSSCRIEWKLAGARPKVRIQGLDELAGKVNYLIGSDPEKWRQDVATFSRVRYDNIYRAIDLTYYGNQQQLEYDFDVHPGASPRQIRMSFSGMKAIDINESGGLSLETEAGAIEFRRPSAYQIIDGVRHEVSAAYRLSRRSISFDLGVYDRTKDLVIDPMLVYSSYLGGASVEQGFGIALDAQNNAYLTGSTASTDFPTVGAMQGTKGNADDAFVVKLNPSGTGIVYATYLGGNGGDTGNAIAVDSQGSAYVTGVTGSGSFPTVGPVQSSSAGLIDAFVSKLSPSGSSLVYSTFLGGQNNDTALGISVDTSGRAYVVGRTDSTRLSSFPLIRHGSPAYKSSNGAGQWSSSDSGITGSSVAGLTIDPTNANTLYAATNNGVFKSTNAGVNWGLTGPGILGLGTPISTATVAIDPTNSSTFYVAGQGGGVYKTTTGGAAYDPKNTGFFSTVINALAIDPTATATIYAGTSTGIFKTMNGGDNWAEIKGGISGTSPRVNEIVLDPTNASIIYMGTNRGMFKSTNGGVLWSAINGGALSSSFVPEITALAIDPVNPTTLYASGRVSADILFKTTDGGSTWSASSNGLSYTSAGQTVTPTVNTLAVDPTTPATLYAATSGGGVFKSTDAGAHWSQSNTGLGNMTALAVAVDRTNPANVYAGVAIGTDAFAVRYDAAGSAFDYWTSFGGAESDEARGVAVDTGGNAYVAGSTGSTDFPVVNALQATSGGSQDVFITKLNASGSGFVYSTYLGGNNFDQARGISVLNGNAYVVGSTGSQDFPLVNAFKGTLATLDTDAFVTEINASGNALVYSTYLGGDGFDQGLAIAVDSSGSAYVTGSTNSALFPTVDAIQPNVSNGNDAFVSKLSPNGSALVYSTYLGGSSFSEAGNGIAVDSFGNAYVIGTTSSPDFPTARAFQPTAKGQDAFVAKIGVDANLAITNKESRDPVLVNTSYSYTFTITNTGPSPATTVTVIDNLPSSLTFNTATPSQGSCSFASSQLNCNLGNMSNGATATVVLTVTPTVTGVVANTASVSSNDPDADTTNNAATETTKISASPTISGRVTDGSNNGISGIPMVLSGSQAATTPTDSGGFYQFAELPIGGSYTVTPTQSGVSFDPESQTFPALSADQTANFLATPCTFSLSLSSQSFGAGGGTASVNVNTLHGCGWTASKSADWITITAGASGTGSGSVSFSVAPTTTPRVGHMTIAGKNFPVYQEFNSCDTPSYSVATYNLSSSGVNLVRIADLNVDGFPDFVVATNALSGGGIPFNILLNDGAGGFTSSSVDTGLGVPEGIALADFNGDGKPDVAMTSYAMAIVRIFFNNGSGGFSQGNKSDVSFTTAGDFAPTQALFTADLNRDGKPDLVVQLPGTGATQILLENGNRTFTQIAAVSDGTAGVVIGLADVNGDNIIDFIYGGGGDSSRPISVRLGDGSGAFGSLISSSGMATTSRVEPADFNGDGNVDLAATTVVNIGTPSNPNFVNSVSILVGDGTGHFTLKSSFSTGQGGIPSLTIGDFNRDGKADVVLTKGTSIVTTVLGDGIGGFGNSVTVDTAVVGGSDNLGLGNADFNGDGRLDIAVADYDRGATVLRNACAALPSIFGRITDSRNTRGLAGATVTLSGDMSASAQTDGGGNYNFANLSAGRNYVVTPSKDSFKFNPVSTNLDNLTGIQTANFVGTPTVLQFTSQDFVVGEGAGSIQISVRRSGDLSGVTTVDYAAIDGTASSRTDYTAALGKLQFGPGESIKTFTVLITDDNFVEGWESLSLVLSNPVGGIFNSSPMEGPPNTSLLEIGDNDSSPPVSNPVDNSSFFVRQHYHDFLNREPDASGLQFWTNEIEQCGTDAACREVKRINVSAAFFLSIEFQQTGYLVERLYKSAYGDGVGNSTFPSTHTLPVPIVRFNEFLADTQEIGRGVVVGQPGWEVQIENNKVAFIALFVQRQRFTNAFGAMGSAQYVDTLNSNAGSPLSQSERDQLVSNLTNSAMTRAQVLRFVAEHPTLVSSESNRAFVLMQFFGYLRRNPDDPQDHDHTGYDFWLTKLNQFGGNFQNAEMVKAFISSDEYRHRFGP